MKKIASRVFVIAEISANHNQDINLAIRLIKKAKECGVDAVKFQTYTPDTLTLNATGTRFIIKHPKWGGQTLYQLYKEAYTPWNWFRRLKTLADKLGLVFFSTAFDKSSIDFLEELGVPLHKIASFELVDLPLIEYAAKTKKPLIMSTGMACANEIKDAVDTAKKAGAKDITLLKCVSDYPSKPEEMNLKTIPDMRDRFGCPIGLSDHSMSAIVPVAAVALGASVIEKHFTLSRKLKTPDSFFSLEPAEMAQLVKDVRTAEKALGAVCYDPTTGEKKNLIFRRSLFAVEDIMKGEPFTVKNVRSIRPGHGIEPKFLMTVLGKRAKRSVRRGTPLRQEHYR